MVAIFSVLYSYNWGRERSRISHNYIWDKASYSLEIFQASNCNYLHDSLNVLFDLVLHNTNNEIEIITSTFNCSGLNEAAAIRDSRCTIDII